MHASSRVPDCLAFGSEYGDELPSVDLERHVLEDDARPHRADHLLQAGASLHLARVEHVRQLQDVLAGDHDVGSAKTRQWEKEVGSAIASKKKHSKNRDVIWGHILTENSSCIRNLRRHASSICFSL